MGQCHVKRQESCNDKYLIRELKKVKAHYRKSEKLVKPEYDTMNLSSYVADSIYEHVYSPLRLKITECWKAGRSKKLLRQWVRFILANPTDDGLDTKCLTICFLRDPQEFANQLRHFKNTIKARIVNIMTGSAGFEYATIENGYDYNEKLNLFKSLVTKSNWKN